MSGDDHGHSSGHGSDSPDVPTDIIPAGSWQDYLLLVICLATLVGFFVWAKGFLDIAQAHQGESSGPTQSVPAPAE